MNKFELVESIEQINVVVRLADVIWSDHYTSIIGPEQVRYMVDKFQSPEAISAQIKQDYKYYLIFSDNSYCGYFSFRYDSESVFLSKYYLAYNSRGQGLGRAVMTFIEQAALTANRPKITLTVNKYNVDSIAIYRRMGFNSVGSVVADIGEGYIMDDYKMEKQLFPGR